LIRHQHQLQDIKWHYLNDTTISMTLPTILLFLVIYGCQTFLQKQCFYMHAYNSFTNMSH
jgi:hypothetical protein